MKLFEETTLTNSVHINATPEKVFDFFLHLVDEEKYRAWHPDDHVTLRWIKGDPWHEGSVVYAEEYLHGKLHKLRFRIDKVVANREIAYSPSSRFLRFFFPQNRFFIEPKESGSVFTATVCFRVGWLFRTFAKHKLEFGLSCAEKHLKEEGENLKKILES